MERLFDSVQKVEADLERIDRIIKLLQRYWDINSDLRLCEIISIIADKIDRSYHFDVYDVRDGLFENKLKELLG